MPEFYLGLDLGGTAVKAGVIDAAGRLLSQRSLPTQAERADPGLVVANMVRAGRMALEAAGVKEDLDSHHLGFVIGPRLNAAGRLASAHTALELLLTADPGEARHLGQGR